MSLSCSIWNLSVESCRPSCPTAYGILVPQPGIEPKSSALECQFFNHWTTIDNLLFFFLSLVSSLISYLDCCNVILTFLLWTLFFKINFQFIIKLKLISLLHPHPFTDIQEQAQRLIKNPQNDWYRDGSHSRLGS